MTARITIGDDIRASVQLRKADGSIEDGIGAATEIKAQYRRFDLSANIGPLYTLSSAFAGASWSAGLLTWQIVATDFAGVTDRKVRLQVKVTMSATDERSYFSDVDTLLLLGGIA